MAVVTAVAALLFAAACEKHATVLPTDPTPGPGPALVITIASDRGSLDAGSTQPATLTVTARYQNGDSAADGTDITLNTTLGQFGVDSSGQPVKLTTAKLAQGKATMQFYAGTDPGVANLLAQVGTSTGKLNISIVQPPAAPVADFTFEVSGLKAIFTDASTGSPTSRVWEFGDGSTSTEVSPTYEYRAAGTYTVKLTVTNAGGSTSKSKFVTAMSGPPLVASFTYAANGLTVLFTDTSTGGPTSWQWDFGDGTPFDTRQNPQHLYSRAGTYIVFLTVRGAGSTSATTSQFITVGGPAPVADFTFETNGLKAIFTDTSTNSPTSWQWNFGDSSAEDTSQNPTHTYGAAGTYEVTLTATNLSGSTSKKKFVTVSLGTAPKAAFTFKVSELDVLFTDASEGATEWEWDFGDNSVHDTRQNPSHRYLVSGTYNVTLTARNAAGESSVSQFVTVTGRPEAEFSFTTASANPLAVNFVDQSSNSPTTWAWNFGDCGQVAVCTSTQKNPAHVFPESGSYTVVLTVTNSAGSDTRQRIVTVLAAPVASFSVTTAGLTATFDDTSTNSPTSWTWNFGDCATNGPNCMSTAENPTHTYLAGGTYTVTLTVSNAAGSNSTAKEVSVAPPAP